VFGVDLGADKVNVLNLDPGTGVLSPNTLPLAPVASGSGPRHMTFHPDRQHAYVLDELVSSITVFDYDPVRGAFIWKQTISTLPSDFSGFNTTAEIRVHPSGQFPYNCSATRTSAAPIWACDAGADRRDAHPRVHRGRLRRGRRAVHADDRGAGADLRDCQGGSVTESSRG
jgi:6-phosphogluconolactonase